MVSSELPDYIVNGRCDQCGFPQRWHGSTGFGDCPIIFDVLGRPDGLEQIKLAVAHLNRYNDIFAPLPPSVRQPSDESEA